MLEHALSLPRLEVCGLLGERGGLIKSYYPVDNIAEERRHAFLMDPEGQLRAMRIMRERGETMAGIFHSHPDTPARPSSRDLHELRYADVYYFIASLQYSIPEIKVYYFDGGRFDDVSITMDMDNHHCQNPGTHHTDEP
jgi:proteasome lid subunit RPN8/RPN11